MLINNFAAKEVISVEVANKVRRFFCHLKELLFLSYLGILSMPLNKKTLLSVIFPIN
jgi:hypothetical protein